jgi:hypothetical protein
MPYTPPRGSSPLDPRSAQLTHFTLSGTSMTRKRHEIVMSSVMDSGVKL